MDINQSNASPQVAQPGEKPSRFLRFIVDILETLVLSVLLFVSINMVSARVRVDGESMEPTLLSGEYLIVNRLGYHLGSPQRGDIVVFHFPLNPKEEYVKRVIGLPGDEVVIRGGSVYINGQLLNESYINVKTNIPGTWKVQADQLFVLGDNRDNSQDSRDWGTVPMNYVIGKAMMIYWPPTDWAIISHIQPASAAR